MTSQRIFSMNVEDKSNLFYFFGTRAEKKVDNPTDTA